MTAPSADAQAAAPTLETGPPPVIAIRARPPSPKRLSRKILLAGALGAGSIFAIALMTGLSDRPAPRADSSETAAAAAGPPESIRTAPAQYDVGDLTSPDLAPPEDADMFWGGHQPATPGDVSASEAPTWSAPRAAGDRAGAPPPPDPQALARAAPILFEQFDDGPVDATVAAGAQAGPRSGFLSGQRDSAVRLDAKLRAPRSRYELQAGAVIPAALVTELNSDLPGRVVAHVTAAVYDSVSGEHLLIPQGSKLIGAYDNAASHGDTRLLLVWNRLIFPDGWSIALQGMEGVDPAGAAGLTDHTDNHLDRLLAAAGVSAIISVIANEAEDEERIGFAQSVGDAAAQEAASAGGRIIDRELSVQPTLRVRAGAPVRVLVTRDIQLRPYRGM